MTEQLRFIASIFRMAMEEIYTVMGPESVQTIFRLIGENQGDAIEDRLRKKYSIKDWNLEQFAEHLVKDVLIPALGEGKAEFNFKNGELTISIGICPFEQANIKISDKLYCTYTEGMIETAFRKALKNIEFKREGLIADKKAQCVFKIKTAK
jgi:predicted ArsR family transcriptional regulator